MKVFLASLILINATLFAQSKAMNQLVYEIRNPMTDAVRFRYALEKIGENLANEVLDELSTKETAVLTLTGAEAKHFLVDETPVLVTILRAGLPLNTGVQNVFPNSQVGFLGMARNETTLEADVNYVALPELKGKTVILSDTMLATGGSILNAIKIIEQKGAQRIIIITAIASKPGIEKITNYNPNIKVYAAAIDPYLNDKGYILPGLGDAGDRAYGEKH